MRQYCFTDFIGQVIKEEWPEKQYNKEITWIATPQHGEEAMSYMIYGRQPTQGEIYSYAAIIAVIPPLLERPNLS